jgi:2-polyprenyl-6-methoxyphenol hydroxylase-like FAD-dependent oxidoreductase
VYRSTPGASANHEEPASASGSSTSRTYRFATANTPKGQADNPSERTTELLRRITGWHAPIDAVLEATPDRRILRNGVYFLDPLPRWTDERLVLLGDGAHATTPGSDRERPWQSRTP